MTKIHVSSHIGRDLLQSAQLFRSDRKVVWEYVSNSLQYTDPGVAPKVMVTIDEKRKVMRILDNGRGMSADDLDHFFTMHGENPDRLAGRIGRGLFGTGKSAAFAIAGTLAVTSTKDGRRSQVRLDREDIEASDGSEIPIKLIEENVRTEEPNGTFIEISRIGLKRIDREGIIKHIERNLARWPADAEVFVDHHLCAYAEPEIAEEHSFSPDASEARYVGDVALVVKVAKRRLDDDLRGIQIFSHGNWHESTLAGAEGKEMAAYIYGEIDVPAIEKYDGPIKPFDSSRSGQLNPDNEVVAALYRFVGPAVEDVRRQLVVREKERRKSEEAKKLEQQAKELAEVLTEDFAAFQAQLKRVRSAVLGRDIGRKFADLGDISDEGPMVEGGELLASPSDYDAPDRGKGGLQGNRPPNLPTPVDADDEGSTTGRVSGDQESSKSKSPRGGLSIEMEEMGESEARGHYVLDDRTIYINLDHPQIAAARSMTDDDDDRVFIRLAAEVALGEYAIALAQELADTYSTPDEPIYDIHETIDRVARRFASLYYKW